MHMQSLVWVRWVFRSEQRRSPPFVIHGFHGKMNDFGKFDKSVVEACGALKIDDEVVGVAGEDVTKCTGSFGKDQDRLRPLTIVFARWTATPPLSVMKVDLRTFVKQTKALKRQTGIDESIRTWREIVLRKEVKRYVHQLYRDVSIGIETSASIHRQAECDHDDERYYELVLPGLGSRSSTERSENRNRKECWDFETRWVRTQKTRSDQGSREGRGRLL